MKKTIQTVSQAVFSSNSDIRVDLYQCGFGTFLHSTVLSPGRILEKTHRNLSELVSSTDPKYFCWVYWHCSHLIFVWTTMKLGILGSIHWIPDSVSKGPLVARRNDDQPQGPKWQKKKRRKWATKPLADFRQDNHINSPNPKHQNHQIHPFRPFPFNAGLPRLSLSSFRNATAADRTSCSCHSR